MLLFVQVLLNLYRQQCYDNLIILYEGPKILIRRPLGGRACRPAAARGGGNRDLFRARVWHPRRNWGADAPRSGATSM